MGDVLKKFGRYFLLDQLAQGGMAEIYRARLATMDGAGRLLVIKKIQAGYGANAEFIQMFRSEIKVTMGFNHPNIVQLYDFGEERAQPFIAMEYVDGKNLRQFISRFAEMRQFFPVELAAYIAEQAACGIHYAHNFKDKISGESLKIVHRDISPQNILISFDGTVKVIDFGIAKASTNSESTRAGVIKGKPSYLSPEQISGETLDGRSDVFSLGTVLWELLAGKKLFAGENDLAVLKLIESCQTHVKPPSTVNPKVPKELDYIVLKSLAKQREKRYQSAEEMQRALHKFLYTYAPDFNPSDLSYYAKDLFKDYIVEDRKRIQRLSDEVEKMLSLSSRPVEVSMPGQPSVPIEKEHESTGIAAPPRLPSGSREVFNNHDAKSAPKLEIEINHNGTPAPRYRPGSSPRPRGTGDRSRDSRISTRNGSGRSSSSQRQGRSSVNGMGGGFGKIIGTGVAAVVALAIFHKELGIDDNLVPKIIDDVKVLLFPERFVERARGPASPNTVELRLNLIPGGGKPVIAVNNLTVSADNPVVNVRIDQPLMLRVERPGFQRVQKEFVIRAADVGGSPDLLYDVRMDPNNYGFLTLTTNVPNTIVTIPMTDGKPWVTKTPLDREKIPAGHYRIHLTHNLLPIDREVEITVQEGKVTPAEVTLELKN